MDKRRRARALELASPEAVVHSRYADAAVWCHLSGPIPEPPLHIRATVDHSRLVERWRPLPGLIAIVGLVVGSPLILLAILEGWSPTLSPKERRKEKAAREDVKFRNALARQQGLCQPFDGNWAGTAGQTLLTWYAKAPDAPRLLVPMANEFVLLAAPSRMWFKCRPQRVKVVARIPYTTALPDIPSVAAKDVPYFRITFTDGSWLALTIDDSAHIEAFLDLGKSLPYPTPQPVRHVQF
ncbi:hypothetical protein [Streptomyces youssoufiensis]